MKKPTLFFLFLITAVCFHAQAEPPFTCTICIDPDIITAADHTTFISAPYAGQDMRLVYDRRVNSYISINVFLFNATFDDGLAAEIQVNPEFGDSTAAGVEANKYATVIGRIPTALRKNMAAIVIHKGNESFGGGFNYLLIHTEQADAYAADGILEETFVHEASHTSLDPEHANAPGWLAAQQADPEFISTYARDNPIREDVAETFLTWLAVRYRRDRISDSLANQITSAIPNRLAYFDTQSFNLYPIVAAPATVLANVSTRLPVGTDPNALIAGFILTGTQPKKVIIRAVGPSLNLTGQLNNPTLELYQGSTLLASNDDWQNQAAEDRQAVIDSTIPPTNDLEPALVRTLPANGTNYTAVVRGVNNATGIAVVQAYDLDRTVDSKLANISTRGFVQTGDNVLFAGTIVLGTLPQKVIVRAIGPSLNLAGKMTDPTLELRDANGAVVRANDNWRTGGQEAEIIASTVPPTNDAESALVETLGGNGASYTAIVRGVNNGTGIAVVEVYALQ
jgi:hypothetical protein